MALYLYVQGIIGLYDITQYSKYIHADVSVCHLLSQIHEKTFGGIYVIFGTEVYLNGVFNKGIRLDINCLAIVGKY